MSGYAAVDVAAAGDRVRLEAVGALPGAPLPLKMTPRSFFSPYSLKKAARSMGRSRSRMPTCCR